MVGQKLTELRRLRRAADLTQRDLADMSGVSEYAVNSAETGRHMPHYANLEKLAGALGVEVAAILPKGGAPKSERETDGHHEVRTARSSAEVITASSNAVVDRETLRTALHAVEAGLLSADAAEDRLMAGVA